MSHVTVGRWGKSLAIRVPNQVADATGLTLGDDVEIEAVGADIVIRRSAFFERQRVDARAAIAELRAARGGHSLGGLSMRELRDEGRP